jgi:hypothetical protein
MKLVLTAAGACGGDMCKSREEEPRLSEVSAASACSSKPAIGTARAADGFACLMRVYYHLEGAV